MQQEARSIKQEVDDRKGLFRRPVSQRQSNRLNYLTGQVHATEELVPKIVEEHRRRLETSLQKLEFEAHALEEAAYVDEEKQRRVEAKLETVRDLIEAGELKEVEEQIQELSDTVANLTQVAAESEFDALYSNLMGHFTEATIQ